MTSIRLDELWDEPFDSVKADEAARLVHEAEWRSGYDRPERGFTEASLGGRLTCATCGSASVSFLELYDYDTGGYPRSRWRMAARPTCTTEHDEFGYFVDLSGTLRHDSTNWLEDWTSHLRQKTWWDPSFAEELRVARTLFDRQRQSVRSFATHPGKPPRASRNPRNISRSMRAWVMERDGFRCRRCGTSSRHGVRLVVDHVIPVARGGTADPENLQTLCEPCNQGKSDRPPHTHDLTP